MSGSPSSKPAAERLSAVGLAAALRAGRLAPREVVGACRARIEARDRVLCAWQALEGRAIEADLACVEAIPEAARGPLWGLPVGVKDIFDTADLPTGYGSAIYAGHRPAIHAAAVARLRSAGAVVLGKTVSTEFAYWQPGPTRNPHDPARSPGGSSSGSAAAVADFMVPLAIGSQTAASTTRPAAYCGIVGFKPGRGRISLAGVKALANSLDSVGVFARDVADAALVAGALAGRDWTPAPAAPVLRPWCGHEWACAAPDQRAAVETSLDRLASRGARVERAGLPAAFDALAAAQRRLMAREAARELAHERRVHPDRLSPALHALFAEGNAVGEAQEEDDRALAAACSAKLGTLLGPDEVLAAPAALGEAPPFAEGTGSPDMSRAFTLLGLPTITLPCGRGASGLPLGLQLAARPGGDRALLAAAAWAERALGEAA